MLMLEVIAGINDATTMNDDSSPSMLLIFSSRPSTCMLMARLVPFALSHTHRHDRVA